MAAVNLSTESQCPTQRTITGVGTTWQEILLPSWPEWTLSVTVEGSADLWMSLPADGQELVDGGAPGAHKRPLAAETEREVVYAPSDNEGRGISTVDVHRRLYVAAQSGTATVYLHIEAV